MMRTRRTETGLTLIELVVSIVLLSLIAGALSTVFVTALRLSGTDKERIKQSADSQTISAFLVRDAQAAGGTDPNTAALDPTLGVSKTLDAGCASATPGASLRLRFKWLDRSVDGTGNQIFMAHVANYYWVSSPTAPRLERTTCVGGGSPTTSPLGSSVASVTAACSPDCDATNPLPDTVSLAMTATPNPPTAPYTYTVTASLRPEGQTPPCVVLNDPNCPGDTGESSPLLVLGGGACQGSNPSGTTVSGNTEVHVYGGVLINSATSGSCPAMACQGNPTYTSGTVSVLGGGGASGCPFSPSLFPTRVLDPFAGLTPPGDTCGTGSNPPTTTVGGVLHYHPGTYPTALSVGGGAVFDTGNYIFCAGVSFSGNGSVTSGPGGVLFYIKGGTLTKSGGIDVGTTTPPSPLSPQTTGPYAGLLIWQAAADTTTPMSFAGNGQLALNGTLYAPTIEVIFGGTPVTQVRSVIAAKVTFTGNHAVELGVPPPPLVIANPTSLPNWTVGIPAYSPSQTVTVTGGSGFNTFTMGSGSPPGLGINSSSGLISGTPNTPGTFTFSVTDTDSFGSIATRPYTVTINGPLSILTASLPDWTVTFTYSGTPMSATGGTTTTPYTWSATNLPPGLTINSSGVIVGSPTLVGTYNPTIKVTDSAGATSSRPYTVHINDLPTIMGPGTLPNWTAGQAGYPSQQMTESNGTPTFKWVASGLPTGLTINLGTGLISGTPNAACTCSVAVTLTDSAGASATQNYIVTINPALGIATAALPNAEKNKPYNFTVMPTAGGTPPYTWSLTGGPPAWISINSVTGKLTGTPPATGTPNVTVRVTDSIGASASKTYSLTIAAPVSISGPGALVPWTMNRDYPGTPIVVANGVANFTWSAPALPTGMSIDASGVISGTPTVSGTFLVAVTVTDSYGAQAIANYSLVINPLPTVSTPSLPNGELTVGYSAPPMAASSGTSPYTWTENGLSTIGLTISPGGVITGTPNAVGVFSVTITAKDTAGATASQPFFLTVNPAPVNNLSLGGQSGGTSLLSGNTIYYHGAVAGSFTITNVITNASGGGPASSAFPALGGAFAGFTHVGSTVSTPSGGPYVSTPFSWTAGTSSSPTEVVTGSDTVGDTATTTLTFVNDSTAPAPTVSAIGNANSTTPAIAGTAGTQVADATHSADSGTVVVNIYSGPTTGGTLLQTFTPTVSGGAWSVSESALGADAQYTVQAIQTDAVGNTGSATRTFVTDTVAPTVTASMSLAGGTKVTVSGTAGTQAANATHSADSATVTVNICTQANYTSHANTCSAGWAAFTNAAVAVAGGNYTVTSGNIGSGTYFATVTQADGAGNVASFTTGPIVR